MKIGRRVALLSLVLLALALAACGDGCKGCAGGPAEAERPLLERVPTDVLGVLHVPVLQAAMKQAAGLHGRLKTSVPDLQRMTADATARLGFDPLRPETLKELGLDPAGEVLLAVHQGWVLLGLQTADPDVFDAYLRRRIEKEMPGELVFGAADVAGRKAIVVTRKGTTPPETVYAYVTLGERVLIVPARSPADLPVDPLGVLGSLLSVTPERSLARRPSFVAETGAVREGAGALVWINAGPAAQVGIGEATKRGQQEELRFWQGVHKAITGVALGLSASGERVHLATKVSVEPKQYALMKEHFAATGAAPQFGRLVTPEAVVFARGALQPKRAFRFLRAFLPKRQRGEIEEYLAKAKAAGFDLEADLLAALSGHLAFAFHSVDLSGGIQRIMAQPKGVNPSLVDSATYLQLSDPKRMDALLARVATGVQEQGLELAEDTRGEAQVTTLRKAGVAMATWIRHGDLLVLCTGIGRSERVLAQLTGKGEGLRGALLDPAAKRAASERDQAGLVISVRNLMTAFPIIALFVPKAAATLRLLGELALNVSVVEDGARVDLTLGLPRPPTAK